MQKLKARLDAFTDAIIAIIITIMVLNIPPVLHDSVANYLTLGKSVGIYLISFIFIANIWYQHATVLGEIDTITYRILLLDLLFLAPLALMPLMTDIMAVNTTRWSVLLYGLVQLVVNLLFRVLTRAVLHFEYTDRQEMKQVYTKVYGNYNLILDFLSLIALAVALVWPTVALLFYLAYPGLMFVLSAESRQEVSDATALSTTQQQDYAALSATERRNFRKAQAASHRQALANQAAQPTDPAQPTRPMPTAWAQWLDQNVDPRRNAMVRARYAQATPEEQARLAHWVDVHKRRRSK
ncbi:TMEM175 family protein [Lacticaseibacillus daqingensis]|uniref:TMEM175 family protein n=1 Tax=Lacticaseibacillus daqingensis TaxID=2486014 RepID=UPI000F7A26EE|nr:TMEM175 family protein [Lacticaseibacillus daqingensis]